MIGGSTRVFAILGDPIRHSLSPAMHNAAFRVLGLDAVYVALRTSSADVPDLLRALAHAGGGGNITVPHKEAAARALTLPSIRVKTLGACNTFWGSDGEIHGENTDVDGVLAGLRQLDVSGGAWLVAGTGGGARAVVAAARQVGAKMAVRSRDAERQRRFAAWAAEQGVAAVAPDTCDVMINSTPLGLNPGDHLPLARDDAPRARVAFDMVYGRTETAWIRQMRQEGLVGSDGRTMLVAQGAAAFRRWFPEEEPPVEVMQAAVNDALR